MINNPISYVKNTRQTYSKQYETVLTEVLVQFADENPAWIPYETLVEMERVCNCLLYTSPSPRDRQKSRMPSSA